MKKLIASFSALILIALVFVSCSENTSTQSTANGAPQSKGTFNTAVALTVNMTGDLQVCSPGPGDPDSLVYTYTAIVSGGTAPYTYLWKLNGNPETTASFYNLILRYNILKIWSAKINVSVTDAAGTTVSVTKNVTVYPYNKCLAP